MSTCVTKWKASNEEKFATGMEIYLRLSLFLSLSVNKMYCRQATTNT